MSRRLLDTSAYSAFMRGDEKAITWIRTSEVLILCPVVLGELFSGFSGGTREKANKQALMSFLSSPRVSMAVLDFDTAECYSAIFHHLRKSGTPVPVNDIWIAACAMQHGARVATSDRHFLRMPQVMTDLLET